MFQRKRGFTLIELLIVVAIIGILAAIAIPNFLEAQTRAKVARAKSEIRNLAVALETYYIDNNAYPGAVDTGGTVDVADEGSPKQVLQSDDYTGGYIGWMLTTPVVHQASLPFDPFGPKKADPAVNYYERTYQYGANFLSYWILTSRGPDLSDEEILESEYVRPDGDYHGDITLYLDHYPNSVGNGVEYDPTNSTISDGDVFRTGP